MSAQTLFEIDELLSVARTKRYRQCVKALERLRAYVLTRQGKALHRKGTIIAKAAEALGCPRQKIYRIIHTHGERSLAFRLRNAGYPDLAVAFENGAGQ